MKTPRSCKKQKFQSLELFQKKLPIIGTFHFLLISSIILLTSSLSFAAPRPSFNYYGQITTELGLPFTPDDAATLLIRSGDRVISRTTIQRTGVAGCNYLAEMALDSDGDAYRDYALKSGAAVTFTLIDAKNREWTLYPVGTIPAVGGSGDAKRLDLSTGMDSFGDGLTDAFRQRIADAANGLFTSLEQVLPDDDFDGDGISNVDEFRCGTDPTWEADMLQVADFFPEQGRLAFTFFAVEGIAYSIQSASEQDADGAFDWSRVDWALSPDSALQSGSFTGRGSQTTLYLPMDQRVKLFKLTVE
ncbi:MAG: hypothetical protein EOL87_13900 [Spartobacteria bacterium]|nr:hypothetical protein [Spartobacteria bacterium]